MDKQREEFIKRFKSTFIYDLLSETLTDEQLFEHIVDPAEGIVWFKDQTRQMWFMWQQAQKVAVPDGFVLVPREPTNEMYLAGTHELTQIDFRDIYDTDSIQVYKAMIEAQEN